VIHVFLKNLLALLLFVLCDINEDGKLSWAKLNILTSSAVHDRLTDVVILNEVLSDHKLTSLDIDGSTSGRLRRAHGREVCFLECLDVISKRIGSYA